MRALSATVGFAVIALAAGANAAPADQLVLESYGGARPADAAALMQPVLVELHSRGYVVADELRERVARHYARSGHGLDANTLDQAHRFIESGYEQFLNGNWDLAITETRRGVDILLAAPAHMARNQQVRDTLFAGLVQMAGAYHGLGDGAEATRTMAEVLRTFPDKEISRAKYAPNLWDLWRQVRDDMRQRGLSTLQVMVDDSRAIIFVNERYAGVGNVTVADLYPGIHRVYVQQGERSGRVHYVDVGAGGEHSLSISWALDAALTTADGYFGLEHESEAARESDEAGLAAKLAATVGGSGLIVLGIRDVNGRRSIIGTVLSIDTGKPIRSAAIALEPVEPRPEKLRALARFLAGEEVPDSMIQPLAVSPRTNRADLEPSPTIDREKWYADSVGWGLTGSGIAISGIGLGLVLSANGLERDADNELDTVQRQELRRQAGSRRTTGQILTAIGAAGTVVGIIKLALAPSRGKAETAMSVSLTPNGVSVIGRF